MEVIRIEGELNVEFHKELFGTTVVLHFYK